MGNRPTAANEHTPGARTMEQAAREIVARTRRQQGLTPQVRDPAVVGRLATLVAARSFEL